MTMIILPERNRPVGNALMPLRRSQWIEASARPSFVPTEHGTRTRWRLRAHHPDDRKRVLWEGWISDREAVDAILYSALRGALRYEPDLWSEIEEWRAPGTPWSRGDFRPGWFGELVPLLAVNTVTFITTTGSGTYTAPTDWVATGATAEAIGSGGSGGAAGNFGSLASAASGGSGGAYAGASASSVNPGDSVSTVVPTGGAAVSASETATGNAGADASFGSLAIAKGGAGGNAVATSGGVTANGVSGGSASGSTGTTKNNGGASGAAFSSTPGQRSSTGGGGAGGSTAGSPSSGTTNTVSAGGQGDGSTGGAGGAGNTGSAGGTGSTGTEWDASHGSGGGGGASGSSSGGGTGGLYGGGGGGGTSTGTALSGAGAQGITVVTFTPKTSGGNFLAMF